MMLRRALSGIRRPFAFWALAGVGLFVSHDAIYLAQVGPGESLATALRAAGHGYWGAASVALALVGLTTLASAALRLRVLRRRAADLGADRIAAEDRSYGARAISAWGRLLAVVAIGFAIQENVEHLIGHSHAPGLGALIGPEYPLALPVIALITGASAILAAGVASTEHRLLAAIAVVERLALARAPRTVVRPANRIAAVLVPILARAAAGRAPPALLSGPV